MKKKISASDKKKAKQAYRKLYNKAFPYAGDIDLQRIEIASFNLSDFKKVGLGLEVEVIHSADEGGHTGKVLMNLPGQLMPEHQHVDIIVLPKNSRVPAGYVGINENVNDFVGILHYNEDGSVKKKNR
ncbi:hypothetical protein ACFL96_10670, partial [Thermoproteota archaeon]